MSTTIFSTSVTGGHDPIFTYAASGDSVIVNAGVTLSTASDTILAPSGLTDLHATINGTVRGVTSVSAVGASIDLTVGSTGRLEASDDAGFVGSYDSSLANHGVIDSISGVGVYDVTDARVENWGTIGGYLDGVFFTNSAQSGIATFVNHGTVQSSYHTVSSSAATTHVTNEGSILSEWQGIALGGSYPGHAATIENSGTIRATSGWGIIGSAAVQITNEGTISGAMGSLYLAGTGDDTITNDGTLNGRAALGDGSDIYHGEAGRISGAVWGQAGDDRLVGGAFVDLFAGGSGDDTLIGGAGADKLTGSTGADRLSGGIGADAFQFATARESVGDTIVASGGVLAFQGAGTAGGDRIDVSAIDANETLGGNQHFAFGTSHALGHLWAVDVGDVTHIRGNVAGGLAPEFDLAINDGTGVHASHYAGVDFIL